MPTKKRRVGFIPRSDVLEIIKQLSSENNLSNSKVISILVEEALYKRGIFNTNKKELIQSKQNESLRNTELISRNYKQLVERTNDSSQYSNNLFHENINDHSFDVEIYEKFIMFLQFQERMNRKN